MLIYLLNQWNKKKKHEIEVKKCIGTQIGVRVLDRSGGNQRHTSWKYQHVAGNKA